MVSRNLTEIFILMRNNAMQNRNLYMEQNVSDRMALMEAGVELKHRGVSGNSSNYFEGRATPLWTDALEETQYALARLENKLKELETLQESHLLRPTLDESTEQETKIELLTQEISRMFNGCHRLIQQIKQQSSDAYTSREKRLAYNVISSLVTNLQQKSIQFRSMQSSYLNKIKTREERSKLYFDADNSPSQQSMISSNLMDLWQETDNNLIDRQFETSRPGVSKTQQQLLLMEEDNASQAKIRSQEVDHIVKSIVDLNHLFKDLSHMIVHQGTILDRIDYNVERTEIEVKQGYSQLAKAERYHRKNRKMACILCLASTTLVLLILLILIKF
uniref:Syntaxin-16 n=1 Tax=Cacopsylla melanoneura TaxID=428564 RepID=A0A8D8LH04_9HEMI